MSLSTLLEAAEFVESKESCKDQSTRDATLNNGRSPVTSNTSDSDSDKGKRRPGGAGTREIHNRLEKNRRAQLKVCFETLKSEIPTLEERKTSNLNILKSALRYIQNLEKKTNEYSKEREDLQKHNLCLRKKLKVLSTDIKNLIEHNGKNGVKVKSSMAVEPSLSLISNVPATSQASCNLSPVSVATQTMSFAKKEKEENESDEEINVDDVAES